MKNDNNEDYVAQQMKNSGMSDKSVEVMRQKVKEGAPEFTVHELQDKHGHELSVTGVFKKSSKTDNYFYNGFDASVALDFQIVHPEKSSIDTRSLEGILKAASTNKNADQEAGAMDKKMQSNYIKSISNDLQLLSEEHPRLFSQLMAKYKPPIDFALDEKQVAELDKLNRRYFPKQFFAVELKIDTDKAFDMLAHGLWIHRDLVNAKNEGYGTWLKPNYGPPMEFGNWNRSHDVLGYSVYKAAEKFAFIELMVSDPVLKAAAVDDLDKRLKNAELVPMTPANPNLTAKVLVSANPPADSFTLFNSDMVMQKHEPYTMATYEKIMAGEHKITIPDRGGEEVKKKDQSKDRTVKPAEKNKGKSRH